MINRDNITLPRSEQEPVAYEYVERRPYGAPGEIRRGTILLEHYRNDDGTIAGDWDWLVEQFKTAKTTISMRPLYTHPQPKRKPLTDDERQDVYAKAIKAIDNDPNLSWRDAIVFETERAHKIGGEA